MKYEELVEIYEKLESTTKRLEKTFIISKFLKKISKEDLSVNVLLIQGKVFPNWDERKIGVASRLILKAINKATGISPNDVEKEWKRLGDLGDVAEKLTERKKQVTLFSRELTVKKVFDNVRKLAELEGSGSVDRKMQLIAELLTSAKPLEAKYIVRFVLEELRIGVGEGSFRDAIAWAFLYDKINYNEEEKSINPEDREDYNKYVGGVQHAFDVTNDFSVVAEKAKTGGLKELSSMGISLGKPLKVMLALKVNDVKDGFERCGKPCDIEYKLDGFRIQAHKNKDGIKLFTRRLDNVTDQFPDIVKYVKEHVKADEFILDSEAVGYDPKTGKYLPFQNVSQRIKRKYDIEDTAKKFPVELNVFDILYHNGKNLIKEDFIERRKILEKIISNKVKEIVVVKNKITDNEKEVEKFYKESLAAGNEGIMFKKLDAPYKPGARVGHMVKMKPVMDNLDLVIVGAEWGSGKRAKWLSSFTLACKDDGNYLEIGKMGTGIKEKEEEGVSFEQLTQELRSLIISEKGREVKVKPKIVLEVSYEEIQKSPTYGSGYALRFPRLVNIRLDRKASDISTLDMVEDYYHNQKK